MASQSVRFHEGHQSVQTTITEIKNELKSKGLYHSSEGMKVKINNQNHVPPLEKNDADLKVQVPLKSINLFLPPPKNSIS